MNISVNQDFVAFYTLSALYVLFWFSLCWWIINLGKSSNQNALLLFTVWILLTSIIPSLVNNAVTYAYPIAAAYETTIDSRDGYHNKWDEAKEPTIEKFKKHYPQFSKYKHPEEANFSWFWYYAMQQMGDDESAEARLAMQQKLKKRNKLTQRIGYFVPSIHTQLSMNALCKTGMHNYLNYAEALETYHENLRLSFYPKIFDNKPIEAKNLETIDLLYFKDHRIADWLSVLPILLWCLVLVWLAKTKRFL